jgi:predicted AlkP superfamily pyrophosphatase or phosphodiesterase
MHKIVLNGDSQKLHLFTFDIDTLNKFSWDKIIKNEMYKKRRSFSYNELISSNWRIEIKEQ